MRISDWSSDVCSSDLHLARASIHLGDEHHFGAESFEHLRSRRTVACRHRDDEGMAERGACHRQSGAHVSARHFHDRHSRSEEHTSELQSLMRISYAVFCLKKQKTYNIKHKRTN